MKWSIVLFLMVSAYLLNAQVLLVPETFASIGEAIAEAEDGDTVLVNQGTYYENISFGGKQIVVTSHYVYTEDFEDIRLTVIHGGTPVDGDMASCVRFDSGEDTTSVLYGFTITGGSGTKWVDPQYPTYSWRSGGGIFIFQSSPTIMHNLIILNDVWDESDVDGASGGGICTYGGNPIICSNIIWKNSAIYGAGVVIDYSDCRFYNNVVAWNAGGSRYGGGGFWMIGNGTEEIIIQNNTIAYNEAVGIGFGGAMYLWSAHITGQNNIIWGNIQFSGEQIYLRDNAIANITYSDVEGGYAGIGNINAEPIFRDSLFILQEDSPCIDTGNPGSEYNDPEDIENQGFAKWPARGTLHNDMGAYGGPRCMEMGSSPVGMAEPSQAPNIHFQLTCYPNPFRENTTIEYRLDKGAYVELVLFDLTGQPVLSLERQYRRSGTYAMTIFDLTGQLHPGIYFCNFIVGDQHATVQLIKID